MTSATSPSRIRYGVLAFACALSMITYLDRVCIGRAKEPLLSAIGLPNDNAAWAWIVTAFSLSYAIFEIPTGWMGDVFGPRKVLVRIVLWWSFFTALTGFAGVTSGGIFVGLWAVVGIRWLFGMGEAGAYPNITRALHNWFPRHERAFAQGAIWMSGRLLGGLTPLIWVVLADEKRLNLKWNQIFWIFGSLGVIWCIAFGLWFRNRPEEKAGVNAAELELIQQGVPPETAAHGNIPWGKIFTDLNVWSLCFMYFCTSYGWYFNVNYLHGFLKTQLGMDENSTLGAVLEGGPLWLGALGCIMGGYLSDRFIRKTGNHRWGRSGFGLFGHSFAAICLIGCIFVKSPYLFCVVMSLGMFANDLTMGPSWATCQDIGRKYAAIIAGFMNTIGNLGGALAAYVTGNILDSYRLDYAKQLGKETLTDAEAKIALMPGYQLNFATYAAFYVIAVLLWSRIDATKPVAGQGRES